MSIADFVDLPVSSVITYEMSRQLRIEFPGATYHVMSRGLDGMATFANHQDRRFFLNLVEQAVLEKALIVHAYCLMQTHFHLLTETPMGQLGRWMKDILGCYASRFNWQRQRAGHFWQGRYRAILVEDGEYFLECSRYIHLNPYRANLARPAEKYVWSSYRNYVGGGPPAVRWVSTGRTMRLFAGGADYRRFVEAAHNETAVSPFERASAGIAWGSRFFVDRVRSMTAQQEETPEADVPNLRRLRRSGEAPSVEAVRQAVIKVFAGFSDHQKSRMLVYALRQCTWLKSVEIARLAGRTPGAVTHTVQTIGQRMAEDPCLADQYDRLLEEIEEGGVVS